MCTPSVSKYGANPINFQWTVVRGDSSTIRIEFLDYDESTHFDTDGWEYLATAYDQTVDLLDNLDVVTYADGIIEIRLTPEITSKWGTGFKSTVAEIPFDLQVLIPGEVDFTWTPVVGTIKVIGDISPGVCL